MSDFSKGGQDILIPTLNLTATKEAESRLFEAKTVNPSTYSDLSYCLNEAYRELKRTMADIDFRTMKIEKKIDEEKARILIDDYPAFLESRKASKDNAELRSAFMAKDPILSDLLDKLHTLQAMSKLIDGKIKTMERTCSYMDKQMQIILKSGMSNNLHVTIRENENG